MLREVFNTKAESMGDFYVYYTKKDTGLTTFAVCTADLTNQYIAKATRFKSAKCTEDQVVLWNWTSNNLITLDLKQIKKLVPLASVLKNGNQ